MKIKSTVVERGMIDKTLENFPIELRLKHMIRAVKRGANVQARAARRLAPKPGYPGDKPGLMPLNKTIRTVVREYRSAIVAVTGPKWPEGAHGHLVEFGHEIERQSPGPSRTIPVPFMRQASDSTREEQHRAVVTSLKQDLAKLTTK